LVKYVDGHMIQGAPRDIDKKSKVDVIDEAHEAWGKAAYLIGKRPTGEVLLFIRTAKTRGYVVTAMWDQCKRI
jgi:hypothetical protein